MGGCTLVPMPDELSERTYYELAWRLTVLLFSVLIVVAIPVGLIFGEASTSDRGGLVLIPPILAWFVWTAYRPRVIVGEAHVTIRGLFTTTRIEVIRIRRIDRAFSPAVRWVPRIRSDGHPVGVRFPPAVYVWHMGPAQWQIRAVADVRRVAQVHGHEIEIDDRLARRIR